MRNQVTLSLQVELLGFIIIFHFFLMNIVMQVLSYAVVWLGLRFNFTTIFSHFVERTCCVCLYFHLFILINNKMFLSRLHYYILYGWFLVSTSILLFPLYSLFILQSPSLPPSMCCFILCHKVVLMVCLALD